MSYRRRIPSSMDGDAVSDGTVSSPLTPSLGAAMDQTLGSGRSPAAAYHRIEVCTMEPTEFSASSSPGASPMKQFACQFDPGSKNGRVLVLLFDRNGESTFQEMSRLDVLRLTQGAAVQKKEEPEEADEAIDTTKTPLRRLGSLGGKGRRSNMQQARADGGGGGPDGPNYATVCDVQVGSAIIPASALEALLATLSRYFQTDYEKLSPVVIAALDRLVQGNLHSRELETLREFKNTMNEFESQVDGVRRVLMELLDNEEDLRLLYLTKLYEDPSLLTDLWSFDSEEAEVLIENYLQDIFSTRTKADLMQHRITNTESLVMLKLDSMRNYLLGVDLIFSLIVISLSVGTLIAGVFGMNLASGIEEAGGWFWGVVITTVVAFLVITMIGILFFKQKGVLLL
ncbi:hypothetical protein BBJ28_00016448 [Nothophytophthora sp. Chile5]|nr:hypothetical protein BBJ28_00016448 [Nothophytophthora sp. Chile5]